MNEKWFALGIDQIEKKLKTNAASGLSRKAARSRGNRNSGHLFYTTVKAPWRLLLDLLSDFSLIILLLGSIFSLFFETEEYLRGLTVLLIIVVSVAICAVMYFRSQRMMESLSSFFYPTARVIRSGKLYYVDFRSVVVGDVILIERGDILCCDARLVTSERLRVKMRVDKDNYIWLEKSADAHVDAKQLHAKDMSNMVHGGSVIEEGSARAIVTAVGKYTYLGAMTGGIPLQMSNKAPKLIEKMRKQFSKVNMIMLISVLPFCVISLLLSHFIDGRTSLLSVAFLTSMSIVATTMSQLTCILFRLYYTNKIRRLFLGRDPSVIKSIDAFDDLADADYIFMLDGCALTDGTLHFHTATCTEGEIRNYGALNNTAISFAEYVYLYHLGCTRTLTTGISGSRDYLDGIKEFIDKSNIDTDALGIRCTVLSYTPGNMIDVPERLEFLDRGIRFSMNVSSSVEALRECRSTMYGGTRQKMGAEGIKGLEGVFNKYKALGQIPIVFTVSSDHSYYSDVCFVGMIVLREGIDDNIEKNLNVLERMGCKVISFVRNDSSLPQIPQRLLRTRCVSKDSFVRSKFAVTYGFGKINTYVGFSNADIQELISYVHSKRKKVMILGFTESSLPFADRADGFITCSALNPHVSGYLDEEISVSEASGQQSSSYCAQTVKDRADLLISRPKDGRGGLTSLVNAFLGIRSVYNNISDYIRYTIASSVMCLIIVALPMLFGDAILDARHVIMCAYGLNLFAFFAFMLRNDGSRRYTKNYCLAEKVKDYFTGDKAILISSITASLSAVVLPWMFDKFISGFDYRLEVLFTSLLTLHLVAVISVYYGNNLYELKNIYKNVLVLIETGVVLALWGTCFIFGWVGALFGVEGWMSLPYFIISLVPALVYIFVFILLRDTKQKRKY